jgi:hypothetical protein
MFRKAWGFAHFGNWTGTGRDAALGWHTMARDWTGWKKFSEVERGEPVAAPIGPGIYEIRDITNGELVAFDAAANVASALSLFWQRPSLRLWKWQMLFGGDDSALRLDLEYRTCAAASFGEAKQIAQCLLERRQAFLRRSTPLFSSVA